jgi:hypothetical protein
MTNHDSDSTMWTGLTLGDRFDAIGDRMDAAYAERRNYRIGSPEYAAANDMVEAVYADLRLLNAGGGDIG